MRIINAKIYTMAGQIIEKGFIEFDRKILNVGHMPDIDDNLKSTDLDVEGAMVFPGFIDAHTHLGMLEDSLGFEGDDVNEMTNPSTPDLRAIDSVNSLDICFEEAHKAGVTTVVTGPGSANPIAGTSVALKTYGIRVDDMVVKNPVAMKFALGENPKTVYNDRKQAPNTRMATAALIREQLTLARDYLEKCKKVEDVDRDIKMEALSKLFEENLPAHFHAHRADDIFTAIRLSEEFDLKYAIIHCTQGHQIADTLAKNEIEAMCGPIFTDRSKPELKSSTPANPGLLSNKGVKVAIITDHPVIPIQYLALSAGLAVREGMDYYEALKSITINPAQICGIDDKVGSLEAGKDADLLIFDKDPLTIQAKPLKVFIDGELIS